MQKGLSIISSIILNPDSYENFKIGKNDHPVYFMYRPVRFLSSYLGRLWPAYNRLLFIISSNTHCSAHVPFMGSALSEDTDPRWKQYPDHPAHAERRLKL